MRIMIKGGVWKNTEDEILKAAVMKYGKNQWARVASLLNRKSSKQCKARWYEWLDPSIKKTEWTRDEEEKLLHLAKLYPCQWRTIAPLVGRTAAQCLDRYERLLDDAERELGGGDANEEDVRRLRPGEIDPDPETRPARPDPVDMDEDEKEMLSEARARLANTRGKKAKRKAREAQLDEARRLASLQKKRELKAAGIYASRQGATRKGGKYMDYSREVPFQKLAPAGFYDVGHEKASSSRKGKDEDFEAIRLDKFEEKRRDEVERIEKRDDRKKRAKLMKQNLPAAVAQLSRLNDPASKLRRSELSLPAPQVTDSELEDVARLTAEEGTEGSSLLLGSRESGSQRIASAARDARTPLVSKGDDAIAQEARNAVLDRQLQTPLLGEHQADREQGTGYTGATPARQTPHATPLSLVSGTPLSLMPPPTPLLHGGEPDDATTSSLMPSFKQQRRDVREGLATLPAPKFAYDVDVPDAVPEGASVATDLEPDARAVDDMRAEEMRQAELAKLARRSLAVQKKLPRPRNPPAVPGGTDPQSLINAEAVRLVRRDASLHPLKGGTLVTDAPLLEFEAGDLAAARGLIEEEAALTQPYDNDAFAQAWSELHESRMYFPSSNEVGPVKGASDADLVEAYKASFEATRAQMAKGAQRAARVEGRVAETLQPLVDEAEALKARTAGAISRLDKAAVEAECYLRLYRTESRTLPARLAAAKARCRALDEREAELQREYADLLAKASTA